MPNLDHPEGIDLLISLNSPPDGQDFAFPPGWSRFRLLMVLIWIPFLISPPDGQDLAQICSQFPASIFEADGHPLVQTVFGQMLSFHASIEYLE